jgi:Raf kinase inhibitor-like YbhB/YbcL family protein
MKRILLASALLATHAMSHAKDFRLTSPDIKGDGEMHKSFEFNGFGCTGDNKSPVLQWDGAPPGTKSYAVTVFDPDAPTGSGWWHWLIINLPAEVTELKANAGSLGGANLPKGATQVRNDFGTASWGGLCPPEGDRWHRYIFTVHALKVEKLELPPDASAALAGFMIHANVAGKTSLIARYGRAKSR